MSPQKSVPLESMEPTSREVELGGLQPPVSFSAPLRQSFHLTVQRPPSRFPAPEAFEAFGIDPLAILSQALLVFSPSAFAGRHCLGQSWALLFLPSRLPFLSRPAPRHSPAMPAAQAWQCLAHGWQLVLLSSCGPGEGWPS